MSSLGLQSGFGASTSVFFTYKNVFPSDFRLLDRNAVPGSTKHVYPGTLDNQERATKTL